MSINKIIEDNLDAIEVAANKLSFKQSYYDKSDLVSVAVVKIIEIYNRSQSKIVDNKGFIYRVSYAAIVDELRKESGRQKEKTKKFVNKKESVRNAISTETKLFKDFLLSDVLFDNRVQFEKTIEVEEVKKTLLDIIDSELSENHRSIIMKKYFQNKTYDEIAKDLGCTKQRIGQSIQSAWRHIRSCYYKAGVKNLGELVN